MHKSSHLVEQAVSNLTECGSNSAWRKACTPGAPTRHANASALRRAPRASGEPLLDLRETHPRCEAGEE